MGQHNNVKKETKVVWIVSYYVTRGYVKIYFLVQLAIFWRHITKSPEFDRQNMKNISYPFLGGK